MRVCVCADVIDSGECEVLVDDVTVATLGPGDSFGELALMYNAPRAATVRVTEVPTVLWAMERVSFRSILLETALATSSLPTPAAAPMGQHVHVPSNHMPPSLQLEDDSVCPSDCGGREGGGWQALK